VSQPCTVLIAAPELLEPLRERAASSAELFSFTDGEALQALEVITQRHPHVVALERQFAASARGAALINRIKADPSLSTCDVRIVALEAREHYAPLREDAAGEPGRRAPADAPLDPRGTRSAPRTSISDPVDLTIDGNAATIVNLSTGGAQVLSPTVLKPNQRVRLSLSDGEATVRVTGSVAWATFEIPRRYRAGIEFIDPDVKAIQTFAERHQS